MAQTLEQALLHLGGRAGNTEIAFFGGSFTAIDRFYMLSLLEAAKPYLSRFHGIRLSTRPDYIDEEVLALLKAYGVTAIELGAQSMDNSVLELNQRGHTAEDVINAARLIRSHGFSLGLQMMTGLYGAAPETDIATAEQFIAIHPDTVRVYPTVIMRGTELATLYQNGDFVPYTPEQSVEFGVKSFFDIVSSAHGIPPQRTGAFFFIIARHAKKIMRLGYNICIGIALPAQPDPAARRANGETDHGKESRREEKGPRKSKEKA